jgi:hypothetical protein
LLNLSQPNCTATLGGVATEGTTKDLPDRVHERSWPHEVMETRGWQPVRVAMVGRTSLLVWDVPPDQEEPGRRFLQELSGSRFEEYVQSRRWLGVSVETVWLAPKPPGGGVAIVYLQALDREQALRELAASDAPFDSRYGTQMRRLFGCDLAQLPRVAGSEPDSGQGAFPCVEYPP